MALRFRFRSIARLLLPWLFLGYPAMLYAANELFQGTGQAFIVGGDVAEARQLARDIALQEAVQQAFESQVRGDDKALRAVQLRAQELTPDAEKLLAAKRIVNEQRAGNSLRLTVEIELADTAIQRLLTDKGVITKTTVETKAANLPSVMVVLSEEISGRPNSEPFALAPAIAQLRKAGFRVVDESAIRNSIAHDRAVQGLLRGDVHAAQAAALQFGASLVITGKATVQKSSIRGGGMQVYGAGVTLRAYLADSGAVLASSSGEGSYPHINAISGQRHALEAATEKAMSALVTELERYLKRAGEIVAVSVSGVSYYQLSILKQILQRDFAEIVKLQQRGFAAGVAHLDITVDNPQSFADKVVQRDFGKFRLDILSYSPHKIDFILIGPSP
jgi:hypothetical protein